jgi:hypothetical protein
MRGANDRGDWPASATCVNMTCAQTCLRRDTLYNSGCGCKVEAGMKAVRQFALMLAVLLPLLAPTMVCALPNAHLNPAERACCRQMMGQCGSMAMPASHGCCQKEVPTADHWNAAVQIQSANIHIDLSAVAGLSPTILVPLPLVRSNYAQRPGSTLPQSPPPAISVLRI